MKKQLLSAGIAFAGLPLVVLAASPADAATRWTFRSSELTAEATFTIVGAVDGSAGNVHRGSVYASSGGYVSGYAEAWTCPDGELPPYWGGEPIPVEPGPGDGGSVPGDPGTDEPLPPEPEPETNCVFEGTREFWGEDADVSISRKLSSATVSGAVEVWTWSGDEDGSATSASGTVDLTFTGEGATMTSVDYSKGDGYVYKYESTERGAVVTGSAAGTVLDDATESWATLRSTKQYERYVSK